MSSYIWFGPSYEESLVAETMMEALKEIAAAWAKAEPCRISSLNEEQRTALKALLQGKDVLTPFTTGSGKSFSVLITHVGQRSGCSKLSRVKRQWWTDGASNFLSSNVWSTDPLPNCFHWLSRRLLEQLDSVCPAWGMRKANIQTKSGISVIVIYYFTPRH